MPKMIMICILLGVSLPVLAADDGLRINDQEYFEMRGLNVMVFHDFYPEGHQGGVTVIQHGDRIASNGDIRLESAPGQWQPIPKPGNRVIDNDKNEIRISLCYPDSSRNRRGFNPIDFPDLQLAYTIRVIGEGRSFRIIVDLDEPVPADWVGKIGFNLELFPGLLFGHTYYMDNESGYFPTQADGPVIRDAQNNLQMLPMAEGMILTVAPESDLHRITIQSMQNPIQLIDGRGMHNNGWFIARSLISEGVTQNAVGWLVSPVIIKDWTREPVIHVSQVGYYPGQKKQAVIELDRNDTQTHEAVVFRIEADGSTAEKLREIPESWGNFLRYHYLQLDFTAIDEPGIYRIRYGESLTEPFRIDPNLFQRHVWQPTLEFFLPVQMCHMKVMEYYRVWHGLCHMDDARMAPVNHNHFDGYSQGNSTLTAFESGTPVPGLNAGGWHDAGDYDLRVESQSGTVYTLALAYEAFGTDYDATLIDQKKRLVEIHIPDGKPDILQQVEQGVLSILGGMDHLGRLYRGIICPTLRQYVLLGDGSTMTDNLVYDPVLREEQTAANRSGVPDDRWVFTEQNPRRELTVAAHLAAASRVLVDYDRDLSRRCLNAAEELWNADNEAENRSKINAAAELYLTTGASVYKNFLLAEQNTIVKNFRFYTRVIGRVITKLRNKQLTDAVRNAAVQYKHWIDEELKTNPFGTLYRPYIWGAGWNIQEFGVSQYYLHTAFPDIFPRDLMLDALNFILGCHPGSNTASFVSGVGSRSLTVAYGLNRADWSFIPGGSASGTALIRPDFPELKEWPFLWQQTEYVMGGGATNFMFLVLAADQWSREPAD
jgi:endoglucanase